MGSPDIREMQAYQAEWIRGVLPDRDVSKTCIKLMTECAEVAEAVGYLGKAAAKKELADCLILLLDIAELEGIDIVEAFYEKMSENKARRWNVGAGCISHIEE